MKKILITGANSYIGTSFEKYMSQWEDQYQVDTLDMLDNSWIQKDFSKYDCVFHVAGIAHIKETKENAYLYYKVNRDLAIEIAKKAKREGVSQFVFLSTMAVYGVKSGKICSDTKTTPTSNYGKAKLEAEERISEMAGTSFVVSILRPPMVYGEGCKGNYQTLVKIARITPVFPAYQNKRSMIYIDRLCWYVKEVIDNQISGLLRPQDESYVCTCEMVRNIAKSMGRKVRLWRVLNPMVWVAKLLPVGLKAFGDLYYDR